MFINKKGMLVSLCGHMPQKTNNYVHTRLLKQFN